MSFSQNVLAQNREISQRLFISELTVKMHLASIFRKLQVNDRTKRRSWR